MSPRPSRDRYFRFWGRNVAQEVDEELRFHVEARVQELVAAGLASDAATARALAEFGDLQRTRETVRAMDEQYEQRVRMRDWLGGLAGDLKLAFRALKRAPSFSAVVVLTLSLGIGANSAVFSVASAFMLRPLPVPRGGEIVVLGETDPNIPQPHELSYLNFRDYAADTAIFSGLAAYAANTRPLGTREPGARAERVWFNDVTANYFAVLGLHPLLGRFFHPNEDQGSLAHPVVVLSYAFWQRRFGGDSGVVGDTIRIAGRPVTIIGVAPPEFHGVSPILDIDAFAPLDQLWPGYASSMKNRADVFLTVFGRLRPDVSLEQASAAARVMSRRLASLYPESNKDAGIVLVRETRARPAIAVSSSMPAAVAAFMTLVALVLLVACANVASLLLVRTAARRRELAVRAALGASRWRLAREVVAECTLLAAGGAVGAVLLTRWTMRALASVHVAADVPLRFAIAPDWRVFAFTFIVSLAAVLAAALVPALHSANPARARGAALADALRSGARGSTSGHQRLRRGLVVAQLAVALAVLVCAALFARSASNALRMDLGFRTDHLLMTSTGLRGDVYDEARGQAFTREIARRIAALPGVRGVATAEHVPLGYSNEVRQIYPEGSAERGAERGVRFFFNTVSSGYFALMGIPVVAGRDFGAQDDTTALRVAIVSQAFAQRFWPGETAVGRRFRFGKDGPTLEIVGVVGNAQYLNIGEGPRPFIYLAATEHYTPNLTLYVQASVDPAALARPVRDAIAALDPDLPVFDVRTMEEHLINGRALLFVRLGAAAAAAFGLLALVLAAVGVYGVVSYSVAQRTREIGIRVALGARVSSVLGLVLREGMLITAAGVVLGVAAGSMVARLLGGLLYGVSATDPGIFAGVAVVLATIAIAASWIPARRATRVDPVVALRTE